MRLPELKHTYANVKKIQSKNVPKDWDNGKGVNLHHCLFSVLNINPTKSISRHHNDLLADHFDITRTYKLIAKKYYQPTICRNIETYVREYNTCLASKAVKHKPQKPSSISLILTFNLYLSWFSIGKICQEILRLIFFSQQIDKKIVMTSSLS